MGLFAAAGRWYRRWRPEKTLGERGEALAARYLRRRGYRILGRHVRLPSGELDLVALDGKTIVFIEVKTRKSDQHGQPSEAVTPEKQRRLTRLAVTFLKRHRLHEHPARFDVIGITWPDGEKPCVEHFVNAFEAVGQSEFYS
ncbi:MAG TPA: YraN family protein [Planctomycetaceae bacterium]|nr:YraN family protein [Planctomycetaceae bacterium]